jgi:hypothetical protein
MSPAITAIASFETTKECRKAATSVSLDMVMEDGELANAALTPSGRIDPRV